MQVHARRLFCGVFVMMVFLGCHLVSQTPSRDLYNYRFMSREWKKVVRDTLEDPEQQAKIIESSRIAGDGFIKLKFESQKIKRDYLKVLACYDCGFGDFEVLFQRIQKAEEGSTQMILDFLDVVRENTTTEELKLLIERKLEP